MPIGEAAIPITDWGYRRSDVTYDVVGVWDGNFFRLDDHIRRFRASMQKFRFNPKESDDDIKAVLHRCVVMSGLRNAYVAMDCLRGRPAPGVAYHPINARNYRPGALSSSSPRHSGSRRTRSTRPRRTSIGPI